MSLRINTNLAALKALRHLQEATENLQKPVLHLSSGLRINSAEEDPAGLVISEQFRAKILAVDQAMRNSQDAVNMAKTAEGAIQEVHEILKQMRSLAVRAGNRAVVDSQVLDGIQNQIRAMIQSIDRIAAHTQWGTRKLLDGTAGSLASLLLPDDVASVYLSGTFNGHRIVDGPITVAVTTQAARAQVVGDVSYASPLDILPAGVVTINGIAFVTSGTETLQDFVARINNSSSLTGVTAQISGSGPYNVVFVQRDYGSRFKVEISDTNDIVNTSAFASAAGVDALADVTMTTVEGVETVTFRGGRYEGQSGLLLTDTFGNSLRLTEQGNLNLGSPTQVAIVTAGGVSVQFGPEANQLAVLSLPPLFASSLGNTFFAGKSVATIDVTTAQGAEEAIQILDEALGQVSRIRGEIGTFQRDFLESNIRSLSVARENFVATDSSIRDADFAYEVTELTRLQILQQAGTAVLAQTHKLSSSVLDLLR